MSCPICDQKPMNCDCPKLVCELHDELEDLRDMLKVQSDELLVEKLRVRILARYLSEKANDPSMMDYYLDYSELAAERMIKNEHTEKVTGL